MRLFILSLLIMAGCSGEDSPKYEKPYEQLNEKKKLAFLNDTKETKIDRAWTIEGVVEHYIKEEFKFPEEVEFPNEYATKVEHMRIREVKSGEVIFKGEAIGKNASGVKQKMQYYVILQIGPKDDDMEFIDAGLNKLN